MSELKQDERTANFTSSKIVALTKDGTGKDKQGNKLPGKPFFTYVNAKIGEKLVGRSLDNEARANPLDWGNLCEQIAHDQDEVGLEYELTSKTRYKHKTLPWSGMPDHKVQERKVTDIKCPFTLISFLEVYTAIKESKSEDYAETLKSSNDKWYWQLISNSILTGINTCELILFMPKRSMLYDIRVASEFSGKYYFHLKDDFELPWTADDSPVPVITKIEFEAPEDDKNHLIERVSLAANLLNK